jgi:hypothetical protein
MGLRIDVTSELCEKTLELAARVAEEPSVHEEFPERHRRKREREDQELRLMVIAATRAEIASDLRAVIGRDNLSPKQTLKIIADNLGGNHYLGDVMHLVDAWPLAWRGWLRIEARIKCNSNCIPPEISYYIDITDKGREILGDKYAPILSVTGGGNSHFP